MELIDLANSVIIFLSQTTLRRWVTFPLDFLTHSHSPSSLDLFISSDPNSFLSIGKFLLCYCLFSWNSKRNVLFHCAAYGYFCADCDHWEIIHSRISLNSAAAGEFCEWVLVGTDVYILHRNMKSSLIHLHGFQLLVLLPLIIEITFFCTNIIDLPHLKYNSDRLVIVAKRLLQLPNLLMLIKQITSQKPCSRDFWRIANSVLNKGKYVIPPLFNGGVFSIW